MNPLVSILFVAALTGAAVANAADVPESKPVPAVAAAPAEAPAYDTELAKRYGADERGMRQFVLVVLKSGPTPVPAGDKRKDMFAGHFANMERLSKAGKLVLAGPFGKNEEGWRGLFVFAVADIEEARALVATDPVIVNGEMIAELHPWYGSAAVMAIPDLHARLTTPAKPATP